MRMSREPCGKEGGRACGGHGAEGAGPAGRILVLSDDAEARRALVLMLESDGLIAYPFASVGGLLEAVGALGEASAGWCCLVMAGHLRASAIAPGLLAPLRRIDRLIPVVILAARPGRGAGGMPASHPALWYADPLVPEEILRSVRDALRT